MNVGTEESTRMLSVLKESLSKENLQKILRYLGRKKRVKELAKKEKNQNQPILDKIQTSVTNCLNSGPCSKWLSQMQSVDFEKVGKPTTPEAHCLHANTQALVSAITSMSVAKTTGGFWNSVDAAHIAASNLNDFYTKGIHF